MSAFAYRAVPLALLLLAMWSGPLHARGQGDAQLPPPVRELLVKARAANPEGEGVRVSLRVIAEGVAAGEALDAYRVQIERMPGGRNTRTGYASGRMILSDEPVTLSRDRLTYRLVAAEGYAPVMIGPLRLAGDAPPPPVIEVKLERGFTARVLVVDPAGKPIPNALLRGGMRYRERVVPGDDRESDGGYSLARIAPYKADADGIAEITHAAAASYGLVVDTPGYERRMEVVELRPGNLMELVAVPAASTTGQILEPHGEPGGGAVVSILSEDPSQADTLFTGRGFGRPVVAVADRWGRFEIDQLEKGRLYALLIEHPEFGSKVIAPFEGGTRRVTWTLGPAMSIRGRVVGRPDPKRAAGDLRVVGSISLPQLGPLLQIGGGGIAPLSVTPDARGRFVLPVLQPACQVNVAEMFHGVERLLTANEEVEEVELRLPGAEEAENEVDEPRAEEPAAILPAGDEAGAGGRSGLATVWVAALLGAAPDAEGEGGAVLVRVVEADGSPGGSFELSVRPVDPPEDRGGTPRLPRSPEWHDIAEGTVALHPIPTRIRCRAWAQRGNLVAGSEPFELTPERLTAEVTLRLPEAADVTARVVDDRGRAVRNARVTYRCEGGWGSGSSYTDRDGRVVVRGVNPEAAAAELLIEPWRDFEPRVAGLKPGGEEVVVKLEPGLVIEGRAVDAKTGEPLLGVEIGAKPVPRAQGDWLRRQSDFPTDEDGRFRLSTLPPGRYKIGGFRANPFAVRLAQPPIVEAGRAEPVTLRMEHYVIGEDRK